MARHPLKASLVKSLARLLLAASVLIATAAKAETAADPPIRAAWSQYYAGQSLTARRGLEAFLAAPEGQDLEARRPALEAMLEICINSLADECLVKYAWEYSAAAEKTPTDNPVQRVELSRRAGYYIFSAVLARGAPDQVAAILANDNWKLEHAYDAELYIRRQVLAANVLLRLGKPAEANRRIDKVLSLIASLKNPHDGTPTITWALSDVMESLMVVGDMERAYGLFLAIRNSIGYALPADSVNAALFELRAGRILLAVNRDQEALRLLDAAIATIDRIELEPEVRSLLLAAALTEKAAACARRRDQDCARAALARHPFATLYAQPGRAPADFEEVRYLAVRAVAAGVGQTTDPVAGAALMAPLGFSPDASDRELLAVLREVGVALASPPGKQRSAHLLEAGRRIRIAATRKRDAPFGAWYRSSGFEQDVFVLAVTQADADPSRDGADAAFTLLQLMSRRGASFDADALTVLGQARDEPQRRAIHQALRLKSRRDALERTALQAVTEQMRTGPATGQRLQQDFAARMRFRDFSDRIVAASQGLDQAGVSASGVNIVTLKQLQAVLAPDEAALMVTPMAGGLVYMCVRRDTSLRRVAAISLAPNAADFRLMQLALTAAGPPSEATDTQFPVASAVRLYDLLIRPFAPCLKPGDHIVWLPILATTGFPIQALLEHAPPRRGQGWDLSEAAWLARDHAVTYAGAASALVAARSARRPPPAPFDFLGVGDPRLTGLTATGEDRASLATRGVRAGAGLAALAPLPETRDELERSARGFPNAKVLTGEAATEAGLRNQLTGAYRYISFATHGLLRDDLQGLAEPALVLTPVSAADPMNDGLLTASEIADLNLSARFVALSACNTANFDVTRMAQDLPALASAFAAAGVPATLGTLWPVDSETGKQVVAAAFEHLRAGLGPATALAEAQRAFLAHPPDRAWLHPRFWAPFVVMGDGGVAVAATPEPGAVTVKSVQMLPGDGEVYAVRRDEGRLLTRFNAPPGATSITDQSGLIGRSWRHADDTVEYGPFQVVLDDRLIIGGTQQLGPGQIRPTLEALDPTTGSSVAIWRGDAIQESAAVLTGGERIDAQRAVFGVKSFVLPAQVGKVRAKLYAFETDSTLKPRLLFEVDAPLGGSISSASFTPLGTDILVAYSIANAIPYPAQSLMVDNFDIAVCARESLTRLELRDAQTGLLKASKELHGLSTTAALRSAGGKVVLGGFQQAACEQDAHAIVLAVDSRLGVETLYRDATLGDSRVSTISAMTDGRIFVAASKDNTVDFPGARSFDSSGNRLSADRMDAIVDGLLYSGMVFVIDRNGTASVPIYLNAASSLYVTSSDASDAGDILLGGGIDDTPAIFHLRASDDHARR